MSMTAPPPSDGEPQTMAEAAPRRATGVAARSWAPVAVVFALFTGWSIAFIERTLVVAYDGRRVPCLFDDAMVSMRYAWNLVHHHGLVWNPGERVEGYSNLLQTLSMAALIELFGKFRSIFAVQVMGLLTLAGAAVFAVRLAADLAREQGLEDTPAWRGIAAFVALSYYPLGYWSLMGMETGLLALTVTGAAYYALRVPADEVSRAFVCLSALAVLTRPDAVVPIAVIFLFRHLSPPRRTRVALREGVALLGVVVATVAFRRLYYRSWIPNTYLLKVSGYTLGYRLANGWAFVRRFLWTAALPLGIAVAGLVLRPRRRQALLVTLFLVAVGYQIWIGGDAWVYWRFLAPTVPLLVLAAIAPLRAVIRDSMDPPRTGGTAWSVPLARQAVVMAVLGLSLWNLDARFIRELRFGRPPYELELHQRNVNVGLALLEVTTGEATVGVFGAGTIPYFSERRGEDFLGKCSPQVAALPPDLSGSTAMFGMRARPGHNKYDLAYSILLCRPTYIDRAWWGQQDVSDQAAALYTKAFYHGVRLNLLSGSPDVLWAKLDARTP